MHAIMERMDGPTLLAWLADESVKGAVFLLLAVMLAGLMRHASASARYMVLFLGAMSLLLLPILSVTLPGWHVLPRLATDQPAEVQAAAPAVGPVVPVSMQANRDTRLPPINTALPDHAIKQFVPAQNHVRTALAAAGTTHIAWQCWVVMAWLVGLSLHLLFLTIAYLSLIRLGRRSAELADPQWVRLLSEARAKLRFHRPVRLLQSADRLMPMTWGFWQATILLPSDADDWSLPQQRVVLMHELAHARRWDCLTQLLTQLARTLHWFNPLIWITWQWMQITREQACDDRVLSAGSEPPAYAQLLLCIAAQNRCGGYAGISMARPSSLEGRLLAILDAKRNRETNTLRTVMLAVALSVAIAGPLAMLRAQKPQPGNSSQVASTAGGQPATAPATGDQAITSLHLLQTPPLVHFVRFQADGKPARPDASFAVISTDASGDAWMLPRTLKLPGDAPIEDFVKLTKSGDLYEPTLGVLEPLRGLQMAPLVVPVDKSVVEMISFQRAVGAISCGEIEKLVVDYHKAHPATTQWTVKDGDHFAVRRADRGLSVIDVHGSGDKLFLEIYGISKAGDLLVPQQLTPKQALGSSLSFRIAVRVDASVKEATGNRLPESLANRYRADLERDGPRPLDGLEWFEAASDEEVGTVVSGQHAGKRYVLLSNAPAQFMLADPAHSWGLTSVRATKEEDGSPQIAFSFDENGAGRFGRLTEANLKQPLAMLINNRVMMVATIQTKITRQAMISLGRNVTAERAQQIADDLANGMPATPVEQSSNAPRRSKEIRFKPGQRIIFSLQMSGIHAQQRDDAQDADEFLLLLPNGKRCRVLANGDQLQLSDASDETYHGSRESASGSRIIVDSEGKLSAVGDVQMTTSRPAGTTLAPGKLESLYPQIAAVDHTMKALLRQRENDMLILEEQKSRGLGANHPGIETSEGNLKAANQRLADYAQQYLSKHPGFGVDSTQNAP